MRSITRRRWHILPAWRGTPLKRVRKALDRSPNPQGTQRILALASMRAIGRAETPISNGEGRSPREHPDFGQGPPERDGACDLLDLGPEGLDHYGSLVTNVLQGFDDPGPGQMILAGVPRSLAQAWNSK